jgi:hypothetical protein
MCVCARARVFRSHRKWVKNRQKFVWRALKVFDADDGNELSNLRRSHRGAIAATDIKKRLTFDQRPRTRVPVAAATLPLLRL